MTGPTDVRIRSIALPTEHGGWGFTIEPVLLGSIVAPSLAGAGLSVATLAVFLARRPVKLVATDLVRGRRLPRTRLASAVALGYGALAAIGIVVALATGDGPFWWPVLAALPLAIISLRADATSRNRGLLPELSGGIAMGSAAAAIAMAGGWDWVPAFGLWLVLAARSFAAIVFARAQVRRAKDREIDRGGVYAAQTTSLLVVALAAALAIVPLLSALAILLLGAGAAFGLARPPVPAKVVGWTQMGFGLLVVALTAVGVATGW